jgi:two-component system, chemotaxis family, CheB/CheR fusion protein
MADDDDSTAEAIASDAAFQRLLEKLSESYNFDFREYKPASLARRIRQRMSQARAESFEAYARLLDERPDEHVALFNTILINVTGFFRDPEAWATLADEIIPRLVSEAGDSRSLRLWSAGCASGEEPFSLAVLLAEHLGDRVGEYQVKIYGSDVDEDALGAARQALYRTDQLKDVPDRLLERYFTRDGQLWRFRRDLRRWCIFGSHNLTQAPPLSHIDLLVCRNVLIYFNSALQDRILSRFHYAVRDGGFLFLGRSESLLARSRLFAPVHLKWRIFQRLPSSNRAAAAVLPEETLAPARTEAGPAGSRVQRALESLPGAVMVVDAGDTVLTWNPVAEALFETPVANAVGRKFRDLDVSYRVEGLRARMEEVKARQARARMDSVTFTRRNGDVVHAAVTIAPLFESYRFIGVLVYAEDATEHARLKEQMGRIAEQHATAIEELQSTNEELETTNEELQSTNEELETTNEELQSTNEELETTVEELQAANAELAALNAELEERGGELAHLDGYHRGILNSLEQSVIVIDRMGVVRTWNHAAERMWGLRTEQVVGRELFALPLADLTQRARAAFERMVQTGEPQRVDGVSYVMPGGSEHRALLRLSPTKNDGGEVSGAVAIAWPVDGGRPGP